MRTFALWLLLRGLLRLSWWLRETGVRLETWCRFVGPEHGIWIRPSYPTRSKAKADEWDHIRCA